jgi:hypothetical protein
MGATLLRFDTIERDRRAGTLGDMADWYTQAEADSDVIRISEPHVNELLAANFW